MIFVESIPPFHEHISQKKRKKSSRKKEKWRGGRGVRDGGDKGKKGCKKKKGKGKKKKERKGKRGNNRFRLPNLAQKLRRTRDELSESKSLGEKQSFIWRMRVNPLPEIFAWKSAGARQIFDVFDARCVCVEEI